MPPAYFVVRYRSVAVVTIIALEFSVIYFASFLSNGMAEIPWLLSFKSCILYDYFTYSSKVLLRSLI
jgi:hypothetical protein